MTNFFFYFSKFIIVTRLMEKLPQFKSILNNADARNKTFDGNNATFKQQCCHKYSRLD